MGGEFEQVTRERVDNLGEEVKEVKDTLENGFARLWEAIESVRKMIHEEVLHRLPPWVTWVIAAQSAVIAAETTILIDRMLGK